MEAAEAVYAVSVATGTFIAPWKAFLLPGRGSSRIRSLKTDSWA